MNLSSYQSSGEKTTYGSGEGCLAFLELALKSLATGCTMLDLVDPLYYYPMSLSFESLPASNRAVHLNIAVIPLFQEKDTGSENMFFSLHANLFRNFTQPHILTEKDIKYHTEIFMSHSAVRDIALMDDSTDSESETTDDDCEMSDYSPVASDISSPGLFCDIIQDSKHGNHLNMILSTSLLSCLYHLGVEFSESSICNV
ncbi:unnamed protein product [Ambrosiozyma monospora]|uniref:Unnamed protein product n=1 Tax=Ambrosiozyma monospora TaxID=43982 RepID=A0ACB5SX19_AMBMO|nr:unnamed protein product [Ambrosiozyma monospora]